MPKNNIHILCFFLLLGLVFTSCSQIQPQLPRYIGKVTVDSTKILRMNFNEIMAQQADTDIKHYIDTSSFRYSKMECGAWKRLYDNPKATSCNVQIKKGDTIKLRMSIMTLNRSTITQYENVYEMGKNDLPVAIKEILETDGKKENYEIIAPWYTGYGVSGNKEIEPYQNIIINLKIL